MDGNGIPVMKATPKMPGLETSASPTPSTPAHIAHHAAARPDAVAVVLNGREIGYAAFHLDIGRMVAALGELELEPGQTVGVETWNGYLHWLVLLACDLLGVVTLSYAPTGDLLERDALEYDILAGMDLVMCSAGHSPVNPPALPTQGMPI